MLHNRLIYGGIDGDLDGDIDATNLPCNDQNNSPIQYGEQTQVTESPYTYSTPHLRELRAIYGHDVVCRSEADAAASVAAATPSVSISLIANTKCMKKAASRFRRRTSYKSTECPG